MAVLCNISQILQKFFWNSYQLTNYKSVPKESSFVDILSFLSTQTRISFQAVKIVSLYGVNVVDDKWIYLPRPFIIPFNA